MTGMHSTAELVAICWKSPLVGTDQSLTIDTRTRYRSVVGFTPREW